MNQPPTYHPPYDSPIEDEFALQASKYFSENVDLSTQVEYKTICGKFRVDFLAISSCGIKTIIECDGKDYHDEHRDEWRDAMILGSNDVDEIYRIRGVDIVYHLEDVMFALSMWSPQLFDDRQKYNLRKIASEELEGRLVSREDTIFSHYAKSKKGPNIQVRLFIEKRHKYIPDGKRQFWEAAFKFADSQSGGDLDTVIKKHADINLQ